MTDLKRDSFVVNSLTAANTNHIAAHTYHSGSMVNDKLASNNFPLQEVVKYEEDETNMILKTRRQLNNYNFDESSFIENSFKITMDSVGQEQKLFEMFEHLASTFTDMSNEIEEDVLALQESAMNAEKILMNELQSNILNLSGVGESVDNVKLGFDVASEGAVRIGGKLSASERERSNIEQSIELLGYIKSFQETPVERYKKQSRSTKELRESLPHGLQKKDWSEVSQILFDLRRILFELNSSDIEVAQKNISRVADRVENELLYEFEKNVIALFEARADPDRLVDNARHLADCLHLFNQGTSLQKRYIFTVVQHRIPNDSFFQSMASLGKHSAAPANNSLFKNALKWLTFGRSPFATHGKPSGKDTLKDANNHLSDDDSDDESSVGYSSGAGSEEDADDEEGEQQQQYISTSTGQKKKKSTQRPMAVQPIKQSNSVAEVTLIDHLSGLFKMIDKVCKEQFGIIIRIFPSNTVARVARMLVQRIFNDPAFGIQSRVDAVLCPAPPSPPLSLADYLDALVLVREKLSALYVLLLECCSDPLMRGMGSESSSLKKAGQPIHSRKEANTTTQNKKNKKNEAMLLDQHLSEGDVDVDEVLRSDAEIGEFFDELISQVISSYLLDYFDKEFLHVRSQFGGLFAGTTNDATLLNKPAANGLLYRIPTLKHDKLKSFSFILGTVGNTRFLDRVFTITTDAVSRMETIGKDDRKLPIQLKELFLLQLGFLKDALFVPWLKFSSTALLRQMVVRSKTQPIHPPPIELLELICTITYGVGRVRTHFDEVFSRPLQVMPNTIAVCKENRVKAFKELDGLVREATTAWIICIVSYVEKTLHTVQSKFDYAPKFENSSSGAASGTSYRQSTVACSSACETVCKGLHEAFHAIDRLKDRMLGLDVMKLLWRPMGVQLVGLIISHIRRQKVTMEGAKVLIRDLKEYSKYLMMSECVELIDMMVCLRELSVVFTTRPDQLLRVVIEDLRHLDTAVTLAFVKARADFASRDSNHFSNKLSSLLSNYKWDTPLFWEHPRKAVTAAYLVEASMMGSLKWTSSLGPSTLRRAAPGTSSRQVSALFLSEIARANTSTASRLSSGGKSVTIDLSKLEEDDSIDNLPVTALKPADSSWDDFQKVGRSAYSSSAPNSSSQFLPSRPDDAALPSTPPSVSSGPVGSQAGSNSISRPDHLIGGNPRTNRRISIIRGSAATLLSGVNLSRFNNINSAAKANYGTSATSNSTTSTNNNGGNSQPTAAAAAVSDVVYADGKSNALRSKNMMSKMTNVFFQR